MLKKTIAASVIGLGSLAALGATPAAAGGDHPNHHVDGSPGTDQIGLVNVNDVANNVCLLPWNDGNVLAGEIPLLSPDDYQACNDGKTMK